MPTRSERSAGFYSPREGGKAQGRPEAKIAEAKKQDKKARKRKKDRADRAVELVKGKVYYPPKKILVTKDVVPPFFEPPRSQAVASIIPTVIEHPTAKAKGVAYANIPSPPWSNIPVGGSVANLPPLVGTLIVMLGPKVIAMMASKITGQEMGVLNYTVTHAGVRMRVRTGENILRSLLPRGEDGQLDEGTEPYDQPSEWWEFWKWTF